MNKPWKIIASTVILLMFIGSGFSAPLWAKDSPLEDQLRNRLSKIAEFVVSGNDAQAKALLATFYFADHETWFAKVFEKADANAYTAFYRREIPGLPFFVTRLLERFKGEFSLDRHILVRRIETPEDAECVMFANTQKTLLRKMKEPHPLFEVRFMTTSGSDSWHLLSCFIHDGRSFRLIGNPK